MKVNEKREEEKRRFINLRNEELCESKRGYLFLYLLDFVDM